MRIKKILIVGFKSFTDKLEITFSRGISGIVGPNGCGKSNIVDAIRWCMGEQSPKQLRGRSMEDVIFNGAGEYKPMGMAEVTILYENGEGAFPHAFAQNPELSVTRRLYRSGESEYLINSVPCRLKDIQEIFMDTGLGSKPYSIIGQGRIGTILEQKPEETRVMLEEAAGITKYRKKVEESQKKIERTETNLQRVGDILTELQRQIRSLKRQASKAKRYKELSQRIQDLELTLYANTYRLLNEESGSKLASSEDLIQEEVAKSTELSRLQAGIEKMGLELEEKDTALSALRKDYLHLRERIHKKEAAIESFTREITMQEELEVRLKDERQEIRERLANLEKEKGDIQERGKNLGQRALGMEGEISLKEKRLRSRRDLLGEIKEGYEQAREKLSAGVHRETGLNHESGYLSKMLDQITDSRTRLEKEKEEIRTKTEALLKASERKRLAREATSERLRDIEDSIEEQNRTSEEMEQIRKRTEMELKASEGELQMCESRLASLRSLTENFEGYQMGVRTIMKARDLMPIQQGHILGLVADVIQVDSEYEQAVEAVLADKLQYIIVECQEDGKQAIDYLKKAAKGRSSFVPLKDLNGNGMGGREDPSLAKLEDIVSTPERYRPLVHALLGDTVLVGDLDAAISSWRNNGKDRCFVTMDGDMVDQRGVVSGGKHVQSSRGLLARKREMAELKQKSAQLSQKTEQSKLKLEDMGIKIEEIREETAELTEEKWSRQAEINEFDKMLFRFAQELDQLENLSNRIDQDLARKNREEDKHKKELLRIQEELRQCKTRRLEEEEFFRKKDLELKEAEQEFDQIREEVAKLRADHRICQEEQRSIGREMKRVEDYIQDSLKRLERIEEDISQGGERRHVCQEKKEELGEELNRFYERLAEAEAVVNAAERERMEFQNRIKEKERKAGEVRNQIELLKEKINRARMEQSEIRLKMENIAVVVKEKFHLDLGKVYEKYLAQDFSAPVVEEKLQHTRKVRDRLGEVNLTAIKEHDAVKERYDFMKSQRDDLIASIEDLNLTIRKINKTSLEKFMETFGDVDRKLKEIFPILFNGGTAGLKLIDEAKPLESGVLVEVQPPGKKLSHMGLLSGGEKALVAMAVLFAIYMIKPSPYCLLDEVDAPLDEANVDRFNNLLKEIRKSSQIIMVTHNRRSMEITDRLYGVTMEYPGISKIVSVDLESMKDQGSDGPRAKVHERSQPTHH